MDSLIYFVFAVLLPPQIQQLVSEQTLILAAPLYRFASYFLILVMFLSFLVGTTYPIFFI